MYKSGTGISNTQSSVFLFNCLDQDLRDDILRANPSTQIGDISEADLTAAVKTLAVKVECKLVHRIRMKCPQLFNLTQNIKNLTLNLTNFHSLSD